MTRFQHLRRARPALLLATLGLLAAVRTEAQGQRAYRAREAMIPMRDGVKLYTQIFEPAAEEPGGPWPILLTRTPYGVPPFELARASRSYGPSPSFNDKGYVFVHQDARGQFRSEGEWQVCRPPRPDRSDPAATDEATDTWDTIEWLLANVEGDNGRVGMWGISYDAWQTVVAMAEAHPALVAVSPQASPGNMFLGDDFHHNGAFRLSYTFAWIAYMATLRGHAERSVVGSVLRMDAYDFFLHAGSLVDLEQRYFHGQVPEWTAILDHGDYDEYWKRSNVLLQLDDVRPAVLNVAGWFDAEDFRGPLDIYRTVERSDGADKNFLVVGPWRHGGWSAATGDTGESLGALGFEEPTSHWFQEEIELPFFEHRLRRVEDPQLPEVLAFETGGNLWREFPAWPPPGTETRALHLHAHGVASFEPPGADEEPSEFVSDPADPVPYTARGPVFPEPGYMVEDQRFLEDRPDVLTFVTEPLEEDLVLAGAPEVRLHFTTTGTDADWIVKLVDVYPEGDEARSAGGPSLSGAHLILSGDIFRAKYRDGFERPTPLEPGRVTELVFPLPDRLHRFRAGHCIEVQLHATWFPLYDRNPQVFTDIYHASEGDLKPATLRLLHREGAASLVSLPLLRE